MVGIPWMASDPATEERDRILAALKRCDFVMSKTAVELGIASSTLTRWVARHGLRDLIAEHNPESAGRRFPRAPHEASRQAVFQKRNRERGLCGCGRTPGTRANGKPAKQCDFCRERNGGAKAGERREPRDMRGEETAEACRRRARDAW